MQEVDTKRVLAQVASCFTYSLDAMLKYTTQQANAIELDYFKYDGFGFDFLQAMGVQPYSFVSACISIASMFYFKEVVFVHEAFPLSHFQHGRLENR